MRVLMNFGFSACPAIGAGLWSEVFVFGHVLEEGVRFVLVVNPAAVVGHAVAHHEVVGVEQRVVSEILVEGLLRDLHRRRLVFHYHARRELARVEHAVAAQFLLSDFQFHLVGKQRRGVALVVYEVLDEMLAHPFFGCQRYEAAAQNVEDVCLAVGLPGLEFVWWQV